MSPHCSQLFHLLTDSANWKKLWENFWATACLPLVFALVTISGEHSYIFFCFSHLCTLQMYIRYWFTLPSIYRNFIWNPWLIHRHCFRGCHSVVSIIWNNWGWQRTSFRPSYLFAPNSFKFCMETSVQKHFPRLSVWSSLNELKVLCKHSGSLEWKKSLTFDIHATRQLWSQPFNWQWNLVM